MMTKTLFALIATSSSLAVAGPRVAALEPSTPETDVAASMPASLPPATSYVSIGAAAGAETSADWVYGATSIDGGYRLSDSLWVRGRLDRAARIGYGAINQSITLEAPERGHTDVMLGAETRQCWSARACVTAGSDAGYRFADGRYSGGVAVAPRLGLDLGWQHLRVRPGVEANVAFIRDTQHEPDVNLPSFGIGLTTAIAYQW